MDPDRYLASLEPVGWRLGLERIRLLCALLGHPQHRFASLHVVGTNGKSSVTLMTAALLEAAGLRTGACISPHLERWGERIRIGGGEIAPPDWAAAVERVAEAVPAAERNLAGDEGGERVTQFEAAIAASFVALATARVDVAVIEAGLGGRLDATNVIPSRATALTSVGLDHTDWLGETTAAIAAEKLAVLRPHTALIVGELDEPISRLASTTAAERHAELVVADPDAEADAIPDGLAPYQRRNAAVALRLAAEVADLPAPVSCARALARLRLPGRAQLVEGDPPLILDAAHNAQGAAALAEALPVAARGQPVVGCISILADKDAEAILAALAPRLAAAVCCEAEPGPAMGRPGARARPAAELATLLDARGVEAEVVPDPPAAIARTTESARRRGGVALCAGSHYLLRHAWIASSAQSSSR